MPELDNFTKYAIYLISQFEGDYDSINPTDVISIGIFQWRASRALGLCQDMYEADASTVTSSLSSAPSLLSAIRGTNTNAWNDLYLSQAQYNAMKRLLATTVSHTCQDNLAANDIAGYVAKGREKGITDAQTLLYWCDLYNQSPNQATKIVAAAGGGSTLTLDKIHASAMANSVMSQYRTRRNKCYELCKAYTGQAPPGSAGGSMDDPVTAATIQMLTRNGELLVASGSGAYQGLMFAKSGNLWIPTVKKAVSSDGTGGGSSLPASEVQIQARDLMYSRLGKNQYTQSSKRVLVFQEPNGYGDCSSTMWKIYEKLGIYIGTYTGSQIDHGTTVDRTANAPNEANLQIGDGLFFGTYWKGGVSHIEMYTGPNECCGHGSGTGPTKKNLASYCQVMRTRYGTPYIGANRFV